MVAEKRKYPRIDLVFHFEYKPLPGGDGNKKTVSPKDISASGVSFEIQEELSVNSMIHVALSFPEITGEIAAEARVVRTWEADGKRYAAAEFTSIEDSDHMIIEEYVYYYEEGAFT